MSIVAYGYGLSGLGGPSSIFQTIEGVEIVDPIEVQLAGATIDVELLAPLEVEIVDPIDVEIDQ